MHRSNEYESIRPKQNRWPWNNARVRKTARMTLDKSEFSFEFQIIFRIC